MTDEQIDQLIEILGLYAIVTFNHLKDHGERGII